MEHSPSFSDKRMKTHYLRIIPQKLSDKQYRAFRKNNNALIYHMTDTRSLKTFGDIYKNVISYTSDYKEDFSKKEIQDFHNQQFVLESIFELVDVGMLIAMDVDDMINIIKDGKQLLKFIESNEELRKDITKHIT